MYGKNIQGIVIVENEFKLSREVTDSATQYAECDSSRCEHFYFSIDRDLEMWCSYVSQQNPMPV